MKLASSILALAALAAILPAQAASYKEGAAPLVPPNAVTDPLKVIYKISGVTDSGDASNVGVATSFHCTNFGNVDEKIRFTIREGGSTTARTATIESGETLTASTHFTNAFFDNLVLTPGQVIDQGAAVIAATSTTQIFCSAMIVEASADFPFGISLHLVRFNPAPGTQE